MELPGGGGFWPPLERDPEAGPARCRRRQRVPRSGRATYGVVIRCLAIDEIVKLPEDYVIDEAATRTLRAKMSTG